jgi:hypothetical protein
VSPLYVIPGFALMGLIAVAVILFCAGLLHRGDQQEKRLATIELWKAQNFGPEPQALVDPPKDPIAVPTEPMELDVAGGLRTTRPTPFVRTRGRHSA